MALVRIPPVEAHVRWDRHAARPSAVRWDGHELHVVGLAAVRDERAAYPADRGPRVTFVVEAADGVRAAIAFDGSRRRWYVDALEPAA